MGRGNGNANVVMVTQNRFSGGARDRFFGGAGEGFLAIFWFKRVFGQFFWPGLRYFGRAFNLLVGFRGRGSVFKFFRFFQVVTWFFWSGFWAFWSFFRFSGRALEFRPRVVTVTGKYHS